MASFLTMLHTSILGALMALAPRVLYVAQTRASEAWGLTPLEDQQLAGMVMWIPAGTIYAGAALALLALWISTSARGGHHARLFRFFLIGVALCVSGGTCGRSAGLGIDDRKPQHQRDQVARALTRVIPRRLTNYAPLRMRRLSHHSRRCRRRWAGRRIPGGIRERV